MDSGVCLPSRVERFSASSSLPYSVPWSTMGDAARKVWGSKGKQMMKSSRVLGIVDAPPAGGAAHRAYPAVFREKASGQARARCREHKAGVAEAGRSAEADRSSRRRALPLRAPAGRGLSHLALCSGAIAQPDKQAEPRGDQEGAHPTRHLPPPSTYLPPPTSHHLPPAPTSYIPAPPTHP